MIWNSHTNSFNKTHSKPDINSIKLVFVILRREERVGNEQLVCGNNFDSLLKILHILHICNIWNIWKTYLFNEKFEIVLDVLRIFRKLIFVGAI